jgi:hypothetical protein
MHANTIACRCGRIGRSHKSNRVFLKANLSIGNWCQKCFGASATTMWLIAGDVAMAIVAKVACLFYTQSMNRTVSTRCMLCIFFCTSSITRTMSAQCILRLLCSLPSLLLYIKAASFVTCSTSWVINKARVNLSTFIVLTADKECTGYQSSWSPLPEDLMEPLPDTQLSLP